MEFLLPTQHPHRLLLIFLLGMSMACAAQNPEKAALELAQVRDRAISAAEFVEHRIANLEEQDFSSEPANRKTLYGGFPVSPDASYRQCLIRDLRSAFAEMALSCQYPGLDVTGEDLLEIILSGSKADFFGCEGHIRNDLFLERSKMLEQLSLDEELNLADRLFSLLRHPGDDDAAVLARWDDQARELASESMLGGDLVLSLSNQARSVRLLYLLGFVADSGHVKKAAAISPTTFAEFQKFISAELPPVIKNYCRQRFIDDGPLRDRNLPVLTAAQSVIPGLSYSSAGVTTQQDYKKLALAHARSLATLVEVIDSPMADSHKARKAIGQIIDYRVKPYYIGSLGIREKGTLPCPPDGELDMVLENALFFGEDGHLNGETYENRVEILEQFFLRPSSQETRDYLFALKSPLQWLSYFRKTLIGIEGVNETGNCLDSIRQGEITPLDLKNLFLARCILDHSAFESTTELRVARDRVKAELQELAPQLAVDHFKSNPMNWNKVDLAFVELSKLLPEFDLQSLSIPTYDEYLDQRKNYDWAMRTLPGDFVALANPDSPNLLDNEIELFQSDYVYRTGKFNKRLNPVFIKQINSKLDIIRRYRNSQFTPPDTRERAGMASNGSAIRELAVTNRHYPTLPPANPQLHDLLAGPEGGLSGLGEFFLPDPKGFESRESAMDAIATADELQLGDTLFHLAMDAGVTDPTPLDKAAAARRWLNYFRKSQSVARFHPTPVELTKAIRGAFMCRMIVQSDDFVDAVNHSPRVAVGSSEDVSSVLEQTVTTQVRIMNTILSSVDPSTALNKDIDHIKDRWYSMKAWHTESMKWLEAVIADPQLMSEVSRIRNLTREKNKSYTDISPAIGSFEETVSAVEPRIIAERHSQSHEELFKPLDFANLIMGQLVTLQNTTTRSTMIREEDGEAATTSAEDAMAILAREITDQLFEDVRQAVAEAGFEDLSKVTTLTQFPSITRAYYQEAVYQKRSDEIAVHELLLHQVKGAIAKAKGRIEAERITDLKTLENLAIRAAKADRIYFSGDSERYSLLIDPSFLLHEWNNRHKIETIAEFRTVETRAQAQTQIFRFRKEREELEKERSQLASEREEMEGRLKQAKKWAEGNGLEFNPEAVIDEMIAMEDQISSLKAKIVEFEKKEETFRQHHIVLAQQLHSYKVDEKRFNRDREREILLATADLRKELKNKKPEIDPEPDIPAIIHKPEPRPQRTFQQRAPSRSESRSSRSSSRGGFFQRLFGGR